MTISDEPFSRLLKDFRSRIDKTLSRAVLSLVWLYQLTLSPILGGRCRFYPTCSEYAKDCLQSQSFFRAIYLIVRRLSVCHPFGRSGFDPAPSAVRSRNV